MYLSGIKAMLNLLSLTKLTMSRTSYSIDKIAELDPQMCNVG